MLRGEAGETGPHRQKYLLGDIARGFGIADANGRVEVDLGVITLEEHAEGITVPRLRSMHDVELAVSIYGLYRAK